MSRFICKYDDQNNCIDVEIFRENASPMQMLGSGGAKRELSVIPNDLTEEEVSKHLFVFLGMGLGLAYAEFIKKFPEAKVAIIDKEKDIFEELNHQISNNVLIIHEENKSDILKKISKWQDSNYGKPFYPLINPFYQRLDRDFYADLRQKLLASKQFDFWSKAHFPKFKNNTTKLLILYSAYFLIGEVERACTELGVVYNVISIEDEELGTQEFLEMLLKEIISFRPDAIVTLNHSGLDYEGVLMDLIEKLQVPLVSWFFDNPHLILSNYKKQNSSFLHLFTWDKDNISSLKAEGMQNVYYLPLGTDCNRFKPENIKISVPPAWKTDVSFVGNSMLHKVESSFKRSGLAEKSDSNKIYKTLLSLGEDFVQSTEHSVDEFIKGQTSSDGVYFYNKYKELGLAHQLALATSLTWEATRIYRKTCVEKLFGFAPLFVGDDGWKTIFKSEKRKWFWHDAINYYEELPFFYPHSKINFNCTSMQMKNASNQRVLDVPACHSFIITDFREQMENMFDIGKEIVCYKESEEIPDLIKYYLKHETERQKICEAGYKRVIACHTWKHRVTEILTILKEKYGKL